jgi:carboxypeptidase Taq
LNAGAPIHSGDDLWINLNPFTPGLNRVEADELSYGLHIMIRTELEIDLLERGLSVEDLPNEWNKRYLNLLGVSPENDTEGCLQDVHWSEGMFGYFPSYLLGHLISAQLTKTLEEDLGKIENLIESKEISKILGWLRKNVHHYGRSLDSEELVRKVSGAKLSPTYFLEYLDNKLEKLSTISK